MESFEQNQSDIANWLSMQSRRVQAESVIVNSEDLGQNFMLHIDKKSPKVFIPQMPRRASDSENNTTARVTVAPTLLGCLIAYASADTEFRMGSSKQMARDYNFRGGYEINEIEFTHCIRPSSKLVYDADDTQEHWLVNFNKDNIHYKNRFIGKVFISSIASQAVSGDSPKTVLTLYIEHQKPEGIRFSPKIHLKPGYYKAVLSFENDYARDMNNEKDFKVKQINENEYNEVKGLSASMLSLHDNIPFMKW